MARQLTEAERWRIIGLFEGGKSNKEIAETFGVSHSTVSRTLKKFKDCGDLKHACGNGRPKKLTEAEITIIKNVKEKNPKTSLRKTSLEILHKEGKVVSYSTIRKWYNDNNIFAFSPIKKPLLSKKAISTREEHSKTFMFMDEDEVKSIIFSDESKINLFYSDGKSSVWREPGTGLLAKNLCPTVKHGGGQLWYGAVFPIMEQGNLFLSMEKWIA